MIYLTFIIPIITCLVLFFRFRRETVWWEYLVVFIPSVVASILTQFIMVRYNADDTEYLGSYTVAVQHYDTWNEWVHRTCYRRVKTGKNSYTSVPYDCSYCQTHPEYWVAIQNTGKEERIAKADYEKIVRLWVTPQ